MESPSIDTAQPQTVWNSHMSTIKWDSLMLAQLWLGTAQHTWTDLPGLPPPYIHTARNQSWRWEWPGNKATSH